VHHHHLLESQLWHHLLVLDPQLLADGESDKVAVNYTQERKVEASVFGAAYNNAAFSFLIAEFKRTDYSLDMALVAD
jgi:hypothetical protein